MAKNIELHFDITHSILERGFLDGFLKWMASFDNGKWRPEKYNNASPAKYNFPTDSAEAVIEKWLRENIGILLKRISSPKYDLDFSGQRMKLLVKNQLDMNIENQLFEEPKGVQSFLQFANALYDSVRPAYGYAAHRKDYLAKNMQITYPSHGNVSRVETWVGRDLSKCMRGIYWANWFGPIYVDFFGRKRMESAPCFWKENLPDGGYLILTSATPFEYDNPDVKAMEQALREHLGVDAFYDISAPHRLTRSPWSSRYVS